MSNFNQSHLLRLLLTLLTWELPYAALAQGSSAPPDSCWQSGFGVPEGTNGEVMAIVWARGNLYIGGSFTAVGGVAARNVARWDGRHWHSLGTEGDNGVGGAYRYTNYSTGQQYQSTAAVYALAVAPNGEVYVGGEFAQAGQVVAHGLARWDGHRWGAVGDFRHLEEAIIAQREEQSEHRWEARQRRSYTSGYRERYRSTAPRSGAVLALAVAPDGALYVGGTLQYAASAYPADTTASSVIRWDGRAWTVPGQGVPGTICALATAPDGRVYAGGDLWNGQRVEPDVRGRVACWNGTTWVNIGTAHNYYGGEIGAGMPGVVRALAVLPDGTLYAAGSGENYQYSGGATANTVARWDGQAWHCFGPGGLDPYATISALAPTANGYLYAAGQLEDSVGARPRLLRWNGRNWQRLGRAQPAAATSQVQALAVTPSGEVYAGGQFTEGPHSQGMHYLARWTHARWDYLPTPAAQGLNGEVVALAAAPSGAVYVGGWFERAGQATVGGLARWTGYAWQPLPMGCPADTCLLSSASALALTTDGQLYASLSHRAPGLPADGLARWDGHAWHALGSGLQAKTGSTNPPGVRALAAGPAHSVYVAGDFATAGGQPSAQVAKWTGTAWEALGAGLPGARVIYTLAVAPNGDLYAGGQITLEAGRASFPMVVRWDGRAWSRVGGFAASENPCHGSGNAGEVYALAVTPTGELYVGGIFSAVDGVPAHNLARWDGTAWHAVGAAGTLSLGCQVHALALAPNGDLYVGGEFEGGLPVRARNLARWDGTSWHAVGPGLNGPVLALACASGNRLVVGGSFTAFGNNGAAASHFAVLDPSACQPTGKQVGVPRTTPARLSKPKRL